jgi:hypothetical protein
MPTNERGQFEYPQEGEGWSTGNMRKVNDPAGLVTPGNIDLTKRPVVKHEGKIATVRSISIEQDGQHILIPTVIGDKVVGNNEAIAHFRQTKEHLGIFSSRDHADAYAKELSKSQDEMYRGRAKEDFIPGAPKSTNIEDRRKSQARMPQGPKGIW